MAARFSGALTKTGGVLVVVSYEKGGGSNVSNLRETKGLNRPPPARSPSVSQTTTTLPIWILDNLFRPNQAPVVNVVATILVIASIIPIYIAQRLSGDPSGGRV